MHQRCVGIDIAKASAKVCLRVQGAGRRGTVKTITDWSSMYREVVGLREYLLAERVSCVVMEATGDYWKPFYYVLEDAGFEMILANARHVKNIPGRKSDVSDAAWLAELAAHGLVRSSFVPPPPIRELRELTRARSTMARDRGRLVTRLEKMLEGAGIKLSVVATDLTGVSSTRMLTALADGVRDPVALADLAHPRMSRQPGKTEDLRQALTGRFTDNHAYLTRMYLTGIEQHDAVLAGLDERIEAMIAPFREFRDRLCAIPGISTIVANVVIAETGGDMSVFPSAGHLTAWAGVAPGQNESAGRKKQATTRPGNAHLKGALGAAALAISHTKGNFLNARYHRIAARRGALRAVVAIERTLLTAIWNMGTNDSDYADLGADHYRRIRPDRAKQRAIKQLTELGYRVTLEAAS